jgi:UDP-2,3-diacylglucosamine hydrolase
LLTPNTVVFISDIHLQSDRPALTQLFFQFLRGPALAAKELYILGDLFDVWVGKDINSELNTQIAKALRDLHDKGVKTYFLCGNRDFLIQKDFLREAHCQPLKDPTLINLQGTPTLLTHGDLLCTQDLAYQRFRKIARNPLVRGLFVRLPKKMRQNSALKLRAKSKAYQGSVSMDILDVPVESAIDFLAKQGVRQMIHGHVHRPKIHDHLLPDGSQAKRVVLGDWKENRASLVLSTPQEMTLATFSPDEGIVPQASYPAATVT